MAEKVVHLINGKVLYFPVMTSDEIIQNTAKKQMGVQALIPKDADIKNPNERFDPDAVGISDAVKKYGPDILKNLALGGAGALIGTETAGAALPFLSKLPGLANVTKGMLSGPLSSVSMAALEHLLQGNTDPTSIGKDALFYEGTGIVARETIGRTLDPIYNYFKEKIYPGSILNKLYPLGLRELKPPASGYGQTPYSHPILKAIEDMFAPSEKEATRTNTSRLGIEKTEKILKNITGREIKLNEGEDLAEGLQKFAFDTFKSYKNVSNMHGIEINHLADLETKGMPVFKVNFPNPAAGQMIQPGQQVMPQLVQTGTYNVSGPIKPSNLMQKVNGIINSLEQSKVKPDPNNPTIKALYDIKNSFQKIDPQTGETFLYPAWDFKDAWATKQHLDELGYEGVDYLNQRIKDVRFQQLSQALNEDITNSIQNPDLWSPQNSNQALIHWNTSKAMTQQRIQLFHPDDGPQNLSNLAREFKPNQQIFGIPINSIQSPTDDLNKIFDDPIQLQKFYLTERKPVYSSTGVQYIFDNRRKDAQGYQLMRIVNQALEEDKKNPGMQILNSSKLWENLYPKDMSKSSAMEKIFSQGNRNTIEEFFKNYSIAMQGISQEGQRYTPLRLTSEGIRFGAALTASMLGESVSAKTALGVGAFTSATVGTYKLAGALANKDSAPLMMTLAAQGPLKMPISFAGRILANVFKNTPITFNREDGSKVSGSFDSKRQFQIGDNK